MIIRPLTVFEREAVRNFYLALSPDDRRKRFWCTISDETISNYVDGIDFTRGTILGAFDEQGLLVGLAELVCGAKKSELAFSVRPDRRGQKIGTRLIQKLLLHARMCGIEKVYVLFLSDNTPMRRMASRAGMAVTTIEGESRAERALPAPGAKELARWFVEESLAYSRYFGNLEIVRWGSLLRRSASTKPRPPKILTPSD